MSDESRPEGNLRQFPNTYGANRLLNETVDEQRKRLDRMIQGIHAEVERVQIELDKAKQDLDSWTKGVEKLTAVRDGDTPPFDIAKKLLETERFTKEAEEKVGALLARLVNYHTKSNFLERALENLGSTPPEPKGE